MDEGPSDAELDAIARRIRTHRRRDMLARGLGTVTGMTMAVVLVALFIEHVGWLIPACAGFALGAPVYMLLAPKTLPDE
jgi:hypothetical protein